MFRNSIRNCPTPLRWRIASLRVCSTRPATYQSSKSPTTKTLRQSGVFARAFSNDVGHRQDLGVSEDAQPESEHAAEGPSVGDDISAATEEGPATMFKDLSGVIDPYIINTITRRMGLETMTQVQSLTIDQALKGNDIVAQAKTGTGKTIGFLLPLIQRIVNDDPEIIRPKRARGWGNKAQDIRALIVSPTRELAEQIAEEARKVVAGTGLAVQTGVGGTQKSFHLRKMQSEGCHILVGTPGRLKDILSDPSTGVAAPNLGCFVLDEADRLMDEGFWPEIQEISSFLPDLADKDRQTMMFSATIPREVVHLARNILKPGFHHVQTVQEDETPTHERVKQHLVIVPSLENQLPAILELCEREIRERNAPGSGKKPFKAIVYFNATAETSMAFGIFMRVKDSREEGSPLGRDCRVYGIHSKMTQQQRTASADHFRSSGSAILMSSDVTARGMDFPNVTHVIQVGLPGNRDTYVHRLGRTARAGKEGEGWLIIPAPALYEARGRLGRLPLVRNTSLDTAKVDFTDLAPGEQPAFTTNETQRTFRILKHSAQRVRPDVFDLAYSGMIGNWSFFKDKHWLIGALNRMSRIVWGMETPPGLSSGLVSRLGLSRVPGINIGYDASRRNSGFGGDFGDDRPSRFGRSDGRSGRPRPGEFRDRGPPPFGRQGSRSTEESFGW